MLQEVNIMTQHRGITHHPLVLRDVIISSVSQVLDLKKKTCKDFTTYADAKVTLTNLWCWEKKCTVAPWK